MASGAVEGSSQSPGDTERKAPGLSVGDSDFETKFFIKISSQKERRKGVCVMHGNLSGKQLQFLINNSHQCKASWFLKFSLTETHFLMYNCQC